MKHRLLSRLFSLLMTVSMLLTPAAPAVQAQDGGPIYLPLVARGQSAASSSDLLYRVHITASDTARWQRLEQMGIPVLKRNATGATVLVDFDQLTQLARLQFHPVGADELSHLVNAGAEARPWLARSLRPLLEQAAQAARTVQSSDVLAAADTRSTEQAAALDSLRAAVRGLSVEQRAAVAELPTLDDDGDGLTNVEESWWCTDPENPNSDGDAHGYTDGQEVHALLDATLPRSVRWGYGPPFGPPNPWPDFNNRDGDPNTPACNDGDFDTIPDFAEAYMVGTLVGVGDAENTDGDKFDDGQEFFGTTFCPGGVDSCNYGSYPRQRDSSEWQSPAMPSWVRPPGDSPFVAAYPVIEFNVDPATVRIVTKEIKTVERTVTQGEEISTGFAETKGNSTSVGTIDTNTRSGWQEHSSTTGGIAPASINPASENGRYRSDIPLKALDDYLSPQQNEISVNRPIPSSVETEIVLVPGTQPVNANVEQVLRSTIAQSSEAVQATRYFAVSALRDAGEWMFVTVVGLKGLDATLSWNLLDNSVWFGLILLHRSNGGSWVGALEGTREYSQLLKQVPESILSARAKFDLDPRRMSRSTNVFGYNFPWEPGTTMKYGSFGVHDNGYQGYTGWKAVDFISGPGTGGAPNSVRAAQGGTIELLCQPGDTNDSQATVKLGDLMYTHLRYDPALHWTGNPRMTGDYLGAMVTGTIPKGVDHCGYTVDQSPTQYHLHLGFPDQDKIRFENWTLNVRSQQWEPNYGGSPVGPGGTLKSGGIAKNSCDLRQEQSGSNGPQNISSNKKSTTFWETIGRTIKSWWGKLTGGNLRAVTGIPGCGTTMSCADQVAGQHNQPTDFSSLKSGGQCSSPLNPNSNSGFGVGGGGSGVAYNDDGGGNFTALRTWSETTTTGEGWSTSHSDLRTETEYSEITRSKVNTLVSSEAWSTATTVDPTDAARLSFSYSLGNSGSDLAVKVTGLRINILIGDLPPITWSAPDSTNIEPAQSKGPFGSDSIPLTLDQLAAIDNGAPIRVVLADYGYDDSLYDTNAWGRSVLFHVDDGIADGDETFDTYLIATNLAIGETYQETLARYFPTETFDAGPNDERTGTLTSISTPEYDGSGEITQWVKHPVNERAWWELSISTGGETEGVRHFKDMPAKARTDVYLRYRVDTDGDGYTDRAERDAGTDPTDPESHPRPLLVAAKHTQVSGSTATVQLALQNLGNFDASSVEIWAIAPDDSITIDDNLIGGGGRVRAGRRVVLGARIGTPDLSAWTASTAKPYPSGQYDGAASKTFQFRADTAGTVGNTAGLAVSWSTDGANWTPLDVGGGYAPWTPLPLSDGLSLAFSPGDISAGETFSFQTALPIDTFSYTIKRTPYTPPLLVVAYNDAQGNHKFVADVEVDQIQEDLTRYYADMRRGLQLDVRQANAFQEGANQAWLTFYNPSDTPIRDGTLFVEVATPDGTVVKEYVLANQTFQPGPNVVTLDWNTADFSPAYDPKADYHLLVFAADRQGTIIENTVRDLDSLNRDALPAAVLPDATWNFGAVTQGEILEHTATLANVGFADLRSRLLLPAGLSLLDAADRRSLPGDVANFSLRLDTRTLPTGPYNGTVTLRTSDPAHPLYTVQVSGDIQPLSGDAYARTVTDRPLDVEVWVPGNHSQGQWITFGHNLGPDPQTLHPVKVYSQDYGTLHGVGKVATNFGQGTASADMFGDGRDGAMPGSGNLDNNNGVGVGVVNSGSAGSTSINVTDVHAVWRINPGDVVLIHQTQGSGAGCWELNKAVSDFGGGTATYQLEKPLKCNYHSGGNDHAQIQRVPQYSTCNVTGTVTPLSGWNGSWGGILAIMCSGSMQVNGTVSANGRGYRGGTYKAGRSQRNGQGEGYPKGPNTASAGANGNGGGGGRQESGDRAFDYGGGGGGGNGSSGGSASKQGAQGGSTVGSPDFTSFSFGGGGGVGGGPWDGLGAAGLGGTGGGAILLFAADVNVSGSVSSNGTNGTCRAGGGGAGGSILVRGGTINFSNNQVIALGGSGDRCDDRTGWGGNGGNGRIRIEYCESLTGSTNPPASVQKLSCYISEQVESAPYTTARLNLPETFTGGRTYRIQYGRKLDFAAAGELTTVLRLPAGVWTNATLDALVSGVGTGDVTFKLDVGNDGTWDWEGTQNVDNAGTFSSGDLAAAFTPYVGGSGDVDVPIKVYLSKPGQVLLTNMAVTRNRSLEFSPSFSLSGTPTEGAGVPLQATIANAGTVDSGPLTISYYATRSGQQTYVGSVFLSNIPAGGSVPAPLQWNTLGFTGPVTVTATVDPYNRIAETDEANNSAAATLTILTRPDLEATGMALSDEEPVAGETVTVTVDLANHGQTAAGAQQTALFDGNPDGGGTLVGSHGGTPLPGGATRNVTFTWTPSTPGRYRLFVRADKESVVDEFDESNNDRWLDVYVGLAGPLMLDSGATGEPVYSRSQGYGVVDADGDDAIGNCGAAAHQTFRRDPNSAVEYRFDHLLPGHFYHLDVTLYNCPGQAQRLESVAVDGMTLTASPVDLGDGQVHRLSFLLDPALYADRSIQVAVQAEGINGTVVSEVNLHDVDYRYADAGGSNDPRYPGARGYGWEDGTSNTAWGTLPIQSVRIDQTDRALTYRFDNLQADKRYNVHLSFLQGSGSTPTPLKIQIDGVDTGATFNVVSGVRQDKTIPVSPVFYKDDGSIRVSITRPDASGPFVNEIALEEETVAATGGCEARPTPSGMDVYGTVTINGAPASLGTVVQAVNPRGDTVGCFTVTKAGSFGFLRIYGEDASASPPIPGMRAGELVSFRVAGALAVATPPVYWQQGGSLEISLAAGSVQGQVVLLDPGWNLTSIYLEPPAPLINQVLSSVDGRYDRVLGENGIYDTGLDPVYNTLQELHCGPGYYVRTRGSTTANLLVEGLDCPADTPIALHAGWNWIGYLPRTALPTAQALASIAGQYQRVIDLSRAYDPANPQFSTLTQLEPGHGYLIFMDQAATLIYPAAGVAGQSASQATAALCGGVRPTPLATLLYGRVTVDGAPAPAGTQVELVTPRGEVAGCFQVSQAGLYGMVFAYGADETATPPISGFQEGEAIGVRVNGTPMIVSDPPVWKDDKAPHELDLNVDLPWHLYMPTIERKQ